MSPSRELVRMAAGTLLASFTGPAVPDWVRRWADQGLGGVCLFGSNLAGAERADRDAVVRVTTQLHQIRPSLLIAIDEEGGDVTRLEAGLGSSVPGNGALGAVGDLALTRHLATSLGRVLGAAGVDLDLAPVADVNVNPQNPVIGARSFGQKPGAVAEQVAAFVMGLQGAGIAACAKHFPGHGDTRVDSHRALPVIDVSPDVLASRELAPFKAAIAADVAAIMTGHLRVPAFGRAPATVNPALLTGLLRDELSFGGAVITDALDMAGIGGPQKMPANVVKALSAGADLCCLGSGATEGLVEACIDAVVDAVQSGSLDAGRVAEAANRAAGIRSPNRLPAQGAESQMDPWTELLATGAEAAERAITVAGDLRPPVTGSHVVHLDNPPAGPSGEIRSGIAWNLAALDPNVTSERLEFGGDVAGAVRRSATRPLVVVVRDPQRRPDQAALLAGLCAARPDLVLVDLGCGAVSEDRPDARVTITTRGASRASSDAVARLLAGRAGESQ